MPQNQRVMPDWAYDKAPKFREFFSGLNEMMTRPTPSTGISPADMVINQTPFGAIRDLESLYNNGLPQLPPTFQNAMGSDTGKAVSYGMAGMAGLGALLPMMNRGGGAHPMLDTPRQNINPLLNPELFQKASPSAFGNQEPMLNVGDVDDYRLPALLRQQAGSVGSYGKPPVNKVTEIPSNAMAKDRYMRELEAGHSAEIELYGESAPKWQSEDSIKESFSMMRAKHNRELMDLATARKESDGFAELLGGPKQTDAQIRDFIQRQANIYSRENEIKEIAQYRKLMGLK